MQKEIVCNINEDFLECGTEFSDRFVYSNYFIPLLSVTFDDNNTPILPAYKKYSLRDFIFGYVVGPLEIVSHLPDLGLDDLLKKNEITLSAIGPDSTPERGPESRVVDQPGIGLAVKDKVKTIVNDMEDLTEIIGGKLTESDRGFVSVMKRKIDEIRISVERAPMMVSSSDQNATVLASPYDSRAQKIKVLELYFCSLDEVCSLT